MAKRCFLAYSFLNHSILDYDPLETKRHEPGIFENYYSARSIVLKRYAYSPLVDGVDSDEEDEPKVQTARDTVKRRGERKKSENIDPEDKMVDYIIEIIERKRFYRKKT